VGSALGVLKIAAGRRGMTVEEYQSKLDLGYKWCSGCKRWWLRENFQQDRSRSDGLKTICAACSNSRPRTQRDPRREYARSLIGSRVTRGKMPHPNTLSCTDCGHIWQEGDHRHEYDHAHGYDGENASYVEAVYQSCHFARGVKRGEFQHG